ncbi:ribonuclease H-like domain-containing protein [Tanacetum coccineum]
MSFDDLYNNFKIVEQEVKSTVTSSSNSSSQNVAFVSTPSSTNDVNTASVQISTVSTPVSTANSYSANLSDATVYAFLANQPDGSQLVHEDLEQIHKDDLEAMDLKWQLALLSIRARKYYQRTGNKITINRSDVAGYDKSKVECFNCHKMGHFARECRGPRNQDNSFMADEEVPTNMAFSDSEVLNDKTCSRSCLASVEEQLVFYKKNEVVFCDQIAVLKRDASFKDSEINALKIQIENLKKEKESIKIKVDGFENASKSLDILMGSQVSINNKRGIGFDSYNAVAPPPTGLFAPLTVDLSNSGLKEFQQPEFLGYDVKINESVSEKSSDETKKTSAALIIEDLVSDCDEDESESREIENVQTKPKQANKPRKISEIPRNNNCDFHDKRMAQKPVLNNLNKGIGQREVKPVWNNAMRTNHQNFSNSRRNFAPTVVLTKSGPVPISTARHMTGNKSYLTDYQDHYGGFIAFTGSSKGGKITGNGKIRTAHLDFEDVYFVKELKFNLFSVSLMCDRKNSVLFIETECLILSPDFKLPDENQVMLKFPKKDNMYSFDLKNIVP